MLILGGRGRSPGCEPKRSVGPKEAGSTKSMAELSPDRQIAWHVLGAVLRALRDRLPVDLSIHFGSQLPLLVRGTYYDPWRPERQPNEARSFDGFLKEVARGLASIRPVNSRDATQLSSTYFHSTSIAVRWKRSANRCAKTCGGYGRRAPWMMPPAERHPVVAIRIDRSAELRTLEAMRSNPCAAVSPRRLLDPTA